MADPSQPDGLEAHNTRDARLVFNSNLIEGRPLLYGVAPDPGHKRLFLLVAVPQQVVDAGGAIEASPRLVRAVFVLYLLTEEGAFIDAISERYHEISNLKYDGQDNSLVFVNRGKDLIRYDLDQGTFSPIIKMFGRIHDRRLVKGKKYEGLNITAVVPFRKSPQTVAFVVARRALYSTRRRPPPAYESAVHDNVMTFEMTDLAGNPALTASPYTSAHLEELPATHVDGLPPNRFYADGSIDISPSDEWIYFVDAALGSVRICEIKTGELRTLNQWRGTEIPTPAVVAGQVRAERHVRVAPDGSLVWLGVMGALDNSNQGRARVLAHLTRAGDMHVSADVDRIHPGIGRLYWLPNARAINLRVLEMYNRSVLYSTMAGTGALSDMYTIHGMTGRVNVGEDPPELQALLGVLLTGVLTRRLGAPQIERPADLYLLVLAIRGARLASTAGQLIWDLAQFVFAGLTPSGAPPHRHIYMH